MQVCIVYAGKSRDDKGIADVAAALARGLEGQGHSCDVFNMYTDNDRKLSFYDYVIIGSTSKSAFGGNLPDVVSVFLKRAGQLSGKRCFAFVTSGGIRSQKTLSVLMKEMESEGMYLKYSDLIKNSGAALALGKRLNVERNN